MYRDTYSEEITGKLSKLRKKDPAQFVVVRKKIDQILANPQHKHKELHYDLKGINRVHIGHFVLVFRVDHVRKTISFEDYDHHDVIYR